MKRNRRPSSPLDNPAFRRWFGDSKVVDEKGKPLVVWHGHLQEEGQPFYAFDFDLAQDVGMHFGTRAAAEKAADVQYHARLPQFDSPEVVVRPFYLSIQNPIELSDPGRWLWDEENEEAPVIRQLFELGHLKYGYSERKIELTRLSDQIESRLLKLATDGGRIPPENAAEASELLKSLLVELGFDGIRYANNFEELGSESWIALFPEQIKLADGTNTTFDPGSADVRKNPSHSQEAIDGALERLDEMIGQLDFSLVQEGEDLSFRKRRAMGYHYTSERNLQAIARGGLGGKVGFEPHEFAFWLAMPYVAPDDAASILLDAEEDQRRAYSRGEPSQKTLDKLQALLDEVPDLHVVWFYREPGMAGVTAGRRERCVKFNLHDVGEWLSQNADSVNEFTDNADGYAVAWIGPKIPPEFLEDCGEDF